MLVSFNVQNFRSFAERQTITLAAGASSRKKATWSFPSGNDLAPNLLRTACLFGPNGSGKTSLVKAIDFFSEFIISSAKNTQEGERINVSAFKFDHEWSNEPTEFEIIFIHNGSFYQYGFAVDTNRIWSEWLFTKPKESDTKTRTLFQREYDPQLDKYDWAINKTYVKGERELWKKSTRDNALFLSTAIQLKAESFREPFNWLQRYLRIIESPDRLSPVFSARQCEQEDQKSRILDFIRAVGLKIEDIQFELKDFDPSDLPEDMSEELKNDIKKRLQGVKSVENMKSYRKVSSGKLIPLDFDQESDGTKVLFSIAGPWLDVLKNGYTLIVDELHNSLHPLALKFLVGLFHDPKINTGNAQLIFTSHETSVMTKGFMHQDQVWLAEKNSNEATELIPLSDYKVRDIAAFQKAYLEGRYGAVPKLREFLNGK